MNPNNNDADSGASLSNAELGARDCEHGQLKRSCQLCEKDAEIERLRVDAERYRWLRNYRPGLILDMLDMDPFPSETWAAELEKALDAVIAPNS